MSGTALQQEQQTQTDTIRVVDRCIGCGGPAYVKVETLELGEFLFCGHDWNKHKAKLEPIAMHVTDETWKLLPKPYDPATDNS